MSAVLGLVGLAVAAAVGGVVAWGRVRTVEVPRVARWETPPEVRARPGVDLDALDEAVRWWSARGHPLRIVPADESRLGGVIEVAVDRTLPEGILGLTHKWAAPGTRSITWAEIRVAPGADALVLAHELAHALGYEHPHAAPSGHILHPTRPGWDGRGVAGP